MHILHITPYFAPAHSFGGVVSMLDGLTQAQVAQGHQVTVLTTDALSLDEPYTGNFDTMREGVRVLRSPNRLYGLRRYNLDTSFGMATQAEQIMSSVDVVHLHEFRTVANQIVVPIALKHNVPIVLSPHGTLTYTTGRSTLKSVWDRVLSQRIAKHIQHVIALAKAERADIRQMWAQFDKAVPITVIPNGVDADHYQTLPDATAFRHKYNLGDAQVILFMGRLHQRKGVDVLARAFQGAGLANTKLLLVGPDEGMQATIEAMNHPDIVLTGFLSGDERLAALATADVFALPAIGEGLSMAVLEAMAAGLPVILSEGCNLPEVVPAGAGEIVPVDDTALAMTLRLFLSDPDKLAETGRNAQLLIRDRFTWERIAKQMTDLYKNLSVPNVP